MSVLAIVIIFYLFYMLQGLLFKRFIFSNLEYTCAFSRKTAYEGEHVELIETIYNRKYLPVPWLKVDIHSSSWLDFAESRSTISQESRRVTSCFFLPGNRRYVRKWKVTCLKRGVYTTENVTLTGGDLFGAQKSSAAFNVNASLTVYPGTVDVDSMLLPLNHLQGDTLIKRWILPDPFLLSGVRQYSFGDPFKQIHWKATAREGRLMVKKNDYTTDLNLTVMLNIQSLEHEYDHVVNTGRIETGIKMAATLIENAASINIPTRLTTNGYEKEHPGQMIYSHEGIGIDHTISLLEILAKLELGKVKDFQKYMEIYGPEIKNTYVLLLTSYICETIIRDIRILAGNGNHVQLLMLNPYIDPSEIPRDISSYIIDGKEA